VLWTTLKHPAEAAFCFSARADQLIPTQTSLAAFYPMASVPACGGVDFPAREVTCTNYATILAIRWPSFSAPPDNRMLLPIRLCSRNRMASAFSPGEVDLIPPSGPYRYNPQETWSLILLLSRTRLNNTIIPVQETYIINCKAELCVEAPCLGSLLFSCYRTN
jgi:hypothetical protein